MADKFRANQILGLQRIAVILQRSEVNFVLVPPGADMARIEMVDTPRGSHAICDPDSMTFDIWRWGRKRPGMKHVNLSAEDAAEILTTEYFLAKAKRVRKRHPEMSVAEIMKTLRRGYQGQPAADATRRDQ